MKTGNESENNTRRRSTHGSRSGGTLSRRVGLSSEHEHERHAGAETERGVTVACLSARPGEGVYTSSPEIGKHKLRYESEGGKD